MVICARVDATSDLICPSALDWPAPSARFAALATCPTAPNPPETACPTLPSAEPVSDEICDNAPGSALRIAPAPS